MPRISRHTRIEKILSLLSPYLTEEEYKERYEHVQVHGERKERTLYGPHLVEEMYRFANQVIESVDPRDFSLIHAHDWTTFPAGVALKRTYGKPLVVHVHITEFHKTGGMSADSKIYSIEREGMMVADRVITVSRQTKKVCSQRYCIPEEKIDVVHNAAVAMKHIHTPSSGFKNSTDEKIVLFAGRITLQKGPDYFVEAARIVLRHRPNVTFIMAGSGSMLPRMIERAVELGIGHKFFFTGYYTREQAEQLFTMADVFVMPSVSEPFGLVAFEAQEKKTPVIISRQSGVSEILNHCLRVDFWNIKDLAGKIISVLDLDPLRQELAINGFKEADKATWDIPAEQCLAIYNKVMHKTSQGRMGFQYAKPNPVLPSSSALQTQNI